MRLSIRPVFRQRYAENMAVFGEQEVYDKFHYVYSCDLDAYLEIKIGTFEGKRERQNYRDLVNDPQLKFSGLYQRACPDLYVTCTVFADGKPMYMPVRTSHKAFSTRWNWNEWLRLPVKYQDLPRNAQIALTVWDVYDSRRAIPVGGTTVSLFGKYGTLRQGIHDLRVWPGKEADGYEPTKTPGKVGSSSDDVMSRLAKLSKRHHKGRMLKIDWLDRLTFREIEMVNEREKRNSNFMYLMIEFPRIVCSGIEYAIVYFEKEADNIEYVKVYPEIVTVPDPEVLQENLVESKHHRLTRSVRSGTISRDLKPNAITRDQLNTIVSYPPTAQLTSEEKDLVWQFRFYLTNQKKALTKFLKCVNWNEAQEAKQATELLSKWDPIDTVDALELLTPQFTNKAVRQYAVSRLKQASDEDLLLYLLQLVQALRYELPRQSGEPSEKQTQELNKSQDEEVSEMIRSSSETQLSELAQEGETEEVVKKIESAIDIRKIQFGIDREEGSDLASFLVSRACTNDKIANFFFWYLWVECKDGRDKKITDMYLNVMRRFSKVLLAGDYDCRRRRNMLGREQKFLDRITELGKTVQQFGGNRKKKIEKLQSLLDVPDFSSFEAITLPLDPEVKIKGIVPKKASIFKSALMPLKLTFRTIQNKDYVAIFKNGDDLRQDQLILQIITLMDKLLMRENLDLKLTPYNVLATSSTQGFVQFVDSIPVAEILSSDGSIQNFFRKHSPCEGAPYGIHPDVMDTYIKSCAGYCVITYILGVGDRHLDNLLLTRSGKLFHIDFGYILGRDPKPLPPPMKLSKEMTLVEFLAAADIAPEPTDGFSKFKLLLEAESLDAWVSQNMHQESLHLFNTKLLRNTDEFANFQFSVVEAMGGTTGDLYPEFRRLCFTAFLHLRRYTNLILNLFALMVDANVPDIALEPDKTVKKVQDKFRLDLSDEEAVQYLQSLIDESVSAVFATVVEQIHKWAQYWRR